MSKFEERRCRKIYSWAEVATFYSMFKFLEFIAD